MSVRFDVWVCHGRMCRSAGGDAVFAAMRDAENDSVAVLRGGCYGLCDIGPNVVVRRCAHDPNERDADLLSLTGDNNETVYCGVAALDAPDIVNAHVTHDAPLVRLTRAVREKELEPTTPIERRMRALRKERALAAGHRVGEPVKSVSPHEPPRL